MKRIAALCSVVLLIMLALAPSVFAAEQITLKINSKIDPDHNEGGPHFVMCHHYYSVSQNGAEVIPVTPLPDNELTEVLLPKTNDTYTLEFFSNLEFVEYTDPITTTYLEHEFSGKKNYGITFVASRASHGLRGGVSGGAFNIDTDALADAGAVGIIVSALVVLGGLAAAAAGAAAGGDGDDKEGSSYSMIIYKEFGNKIKYNDDAVYVYAKMIEITADGGEIERPDLTGQISIFSGNPRLLEMSACAMAGEYMGAGVIAGPDAGEDINADAVISFRFTGYGGIFQNNVKFKVIGKEYISLETEKIMVFAASGKSFELPYEPINFMVQPDEITVNAMQGAKVPFDLSLGVNEHQQPVIIATDKAPREESATRALDSFSCEIIAKNSKEYARTVFTVVMCHEGLTVTFPRGRGDEPSIELKADAEASSEVAFYFYLWDPGQKTLVAHPQALETLTLTRRHSDDLLVRNAAEVSGLTMEYDKPYMQDGVLYSLSTKRPFPSNRPHIDVVMDAAVNFGEKRYTSSFTVKFVKVDEGPGSPSWEEEYRKLERIINLIVPERYSHDFFSIIHEKKNELDAPGLALLRRTLVNRAIELNEQMAQGYLNEAAWNDLAVKVLEYFEIAGDVAMSALTTAFMGPLAGVGADIVRQYIVSALKAKAEGRSIEQWFNSEVKGIIPMLSAMGMGVLTDPQSIEYALGRSMKTQVVAWGTYFGYNFYNEMYNNKKSLYEAAKSTAFIFGKRVAVKYLAGRLSQSWAAQKIDSLKAKIKSEGGLSKSDMLEIMQDSQFVRSIKNSGDMELQTAFNQSLRQHVYAPHDTALLHWLNKQPQLEGREIKLDDFTTPGKQQSAVNTDRDYRVLMKSGNDWVEVPTDLWKNKSYQIFSERTGFDTQSAYKTLNVEKEIWDRMPPEAQREMWANKNYRQLATDRTHAEACADFSDQNPEGVANITKVKAGQSRLQDAENLGRMYENKVIGELLGNQNKTEALAQLQKGYEQLIDIRKGYAKQNIRLPHMDDNLTAGIRDLKNIPTDLRAGNQPHFVKDDTIIDMAVRLRAEIARMGKTD